MLAKFLNYADEDSLTASVFSHLLHLPSEQFWRSLREACYPANLPDYPGEPELIPWPIWDPTNTGNSRYVEPDLLVRFDSFDLIVEAKRWDNGMQDPDQWQRELVAYTNKYGKEKKEVRLLAIGGIHTDHEEMSRNQSFGCPVHTCRWSSVLHECQGLKRELEATNKNSPSSRTFADIRILTDLVDFFVKHGFPPLQWFADFDFKSNFLDGRIDSDQQYFRNISLQLEPS